MHNEIKKVNTGVYGISSILRNISLLMTSCCSICHSKRNYRFVNHIYICISLLLVNVWLWWQHNLCYKINSVKLYTAVHSIMRKFSYLLRVICRYFIVLWVDMPTTQSFLYIMMRFVSRICKCKAKRFHSMCCAFSNKCHPSLQH